jgi:hypothetical protein
MKGTMVRYGLDVCMCFSLCNIICDRSESFTNSKYSGNLQAGYPSVMFLFFLF